MICTLNSEKEIHKVRKELEQNRKMLLDSICYIDFSCLKKESKNKSKK